MSRRAPPTLAQTLCWAALLHIFRHEPSAVADYAGRALRICQEHRIAVYPAYALCVTGWALGASGESEKGLTQIAQGVVLIQLLSRKWVNGPTQQAFIQPGSACIAP